MYGISLFETSSIAWRGVMDTDAYKYAKEFTIGEFINYWDTQGKRHAIKN